MVLSERNELIREIKIKTGITDQKLGNLLGLSKQRVNKIVTQSPKNAIIQPMRINIKIGNHPISATQASKITNIPYWTIQRWVDRGLVNIISRPDRRACTGQPVLLDPISLQERIDRYKPRRKSAVV